MKADWESIRTASHGLWFSILPAIGIPRESLTNRHQPCPACGGKDRFRFDDKDGRGTFYCSHWDKGAGDGFHLVMHFLRCDFQAAVEAVAAVLGMADSQIPAAPLPPEPSRQSEAKQDKREQLQALWLGGYPLSSSDPAHAYLKGRGLALPDLPHELRYCHELPYWQPMADGSFQILGRYPAMLAAIRDNEGQLMGVHQTYLQAAYSKPYGENGSHIPHFSKLVTYHPETGEPLPARKIRNRYQGSLKGSAVKLFPLPAGKRLMVAEGIETALAARELFADGSEYGLWACLSANGMKALNLPDGLTELVVIADHDSPHRTGQQAAHDLAVRAIKAGIKPVLWQPETEGSDALDELNRLNDSADTKPTEKQHDNR